MNLFVPLKFSLQRYGFNTDIVPTRADTGMFVYSGQGVQVQGRSSSSCVVKTFAALARLKPEACLFVAGKNVSDLREFLMEQGYTFSSKYSKQDNQYYHSLGISKIHKAESKEKVKEYMELYGDTPCDIAPDFYDQDTEETYTIDLATAESNPRQQLLSKLMYEVYSKNGHLSRQMNLKPHVESMQFIIKY